ncbi:hypothetical protein [Calothrix sp. UHCC 0171]|nr:hypothetical protein [Calothrix sp. UHCC 0171]MEA5574737.1 hypothetical protein [Calothrix sp. UHCC 0171]
MLDQIFVIAFGEGLVRSLLLLVTVCDALSEDLLRSPTIFPILQTTIL